MSRELCIPRFRKGSKPRGVGFLDYRWENGSTITIGFANGNSSEIQNYIEVVAEYQAIGINLNFDFVDNWTEAQTRVSFNKGDGSWSEVGTNALLINKRETTVNISLNTKANIRHEFGHKLGLGHEQSSPNANILWNTSEVERIFISQYGWTKRMIEDNIYKKYLSENLLATEYDPTSIMQYPIAKNLTLNGFSIPLNTHLSELDKMTLRKLYPKPNQGNPNIDPITQSPIKSEESPILDTNNNDLILSPKTNYKPYLWGAGIAGLIYLGTR